MVQRLNVDEEGDVRPARNELDEKLSVLRWQVPGRANRNADVKRETGAPSWWVDDEEASQATLAAMRAMGAKV